MSNYRSNHRRTDDPLWRERGFYSGAREFNRTWEWIALGVAVAIILGITFGVGQPGQTGMSTTFSNTPLAMHGSSAHRAGAQP
jgi:hypothetical protein